VAARGRNRSVELKPPSPCNWLAELDKIVRELPAESDWSDDSRLSPQRCRRFVMARFPDLLRPFADLVLGYELSRGEKLIRKSEHAERILRDLKTAQRSQLAGLLLDVVEALDYYGRHRHSSKSASKLAAEHNRRKRMLLRKVSKIHRESELLLKYAGDLHPLLGLEYVHAAKHCLKALAKLKEDTSDDEFYRSLQSQYPTLEDPRQLGMVELYWFFRYECRCSGPDSEVRVAMLANEFLDSPLKYIPKYNGIESQGCPAVRIAVSRFSPAHNELK